ncbi:hypothetical protein HN630_00160 [archaeon]|jgi:hypothetical protein|nr:hypothetical protein [archaeon]
MKYDGAKEFLKSLEEVIDKKRYHAALCKRNTAPIEIKLRDKSKLQIKVENDRLVASRICSTSNSINFEFIFKIDKMKNTVGLWPLILKQKDQPEISCVTNLRNKELVNVHRQSELMEIANMWGKNIRAQKVASFLDQSSVGTL